MEQTTKLKKKEHLEETQIIQLIVFSLGDQEFGVDIQQVREIIRVGMITPVPDSPDFIDGITNVRGEIVLVINPKERFHLALKQATQSMHVVITEQEQNLFGLLVDEVTEVLRIPVTEIKPTPKLVVKIDRVYIQGVITVENRLIIVLDLTKVLSENELIKLSSVFRQIQERDDELAQISEIKQAIPEIAAESEDPNENQEE